MHAEHRRTRDQISRLAWRRMRDRPALAREFATKVRVSAEGVDAAELNDILAAACVARNGWKVILGRCSPEN